jgi:hypothetical protein
MSGPNFKIETIHVFMTVDPEDNTEGVISFFDGSTWMPMVAADPIRLELLYKMAVEICQQAGRSFRVLKFSAREDVTDSIMEKLKV